MAVKSLQELQDGLIEERRAFRLNSSLRIDEFLEGLSETEQLELVQESIADNLSVPMQAFASSEYETVQEAVVDWLSGDAYDPLVASILTESEFPEVSEAAYEVLEAYTTSVSGIRSYFLSFA